MLEKRSEIRKGLTFGDALVEESDDVEDIGEERSSYEGNPNSIPRAVNGFVGQH